MIQVPEPFARTTIEREGEPGAQWIGELPAIAQRLLDRWGCEADGEVTYGGVGLVVPASRSWQGPAVLKVSFPHPGNTHEPDALAAWGGHGAVRLYQRDDEHFAMLLERTRTSTLAQVQDGDEVVAVAGRISRRLAVPAPPGLPRLRERADDWEEQLLRDSRELPHSLPPYVVDAAVDTVRVLGRDQPDVLVHGDLHARNILAADREAWLAVDAKGYAGDRAYDGGTLLKSRATVLLEATDLGRSARRVLDVFTESAELDRHRTQRWAQLHAVQAAFWGRRHGFRRARRGPGLEQLTDFVERLARVLAEGV
ncbi:aminoglycoside phosphotransferase family protein [Streptacidiphilus sp. EB103A]|uniref:aminoglycoside phosphotransferase family protein n=1 Tax=Streptacidiphilus sp. EB103A TaxID=3156275 RepID=UPI00351242B8